MVGSGPGNRSRGDHSFWTISGTEYPISNASMQPGKRGLGANISGTFGEPGRILGAAGPGVVEFRTK
jgi:hypothetical protein